MSTYEDDALARLDEALYASLGPGGQWVFDKSNSTTETEVEVEDLTSPAEEECKHGFLPADCWLCKRPPAMVKLSTPKDDRPSRVFSARYPGKCRECGHPIEIGDDIVMYTGSAFHEDCLFDS